SERQRTGQLPLGRVVFMPGAIRVAQTHTEAGASIGPGAPVFGATTTARVVRVALTADRQAGVHPGDPVQVTVPGLAQPVAGSVRDIGTVATPPSQGTGQATVPMVVTVTMP